MLGDSSTVVGSSSGDAAPAVAATETPTASTIAAAAASNTLEGGGSDVGGGGGDGARSNSADEDRINNRGEEGDRNFGGNRWPRQETLALLKIRSDMDVAFRDASVKGPLWDEVSRKLAELGYHRSAKKCKEKFENVYKYHKRTKEGRTGKSDGKTYRFFDQLQALENQPSSSSFPISPTSQQQHQKSTHHQHQPTSMAVVPASSTLATMSAVGGGGGGIVTANVVVPSHQNTVPSATHPLMSISSQPSSTTTTTTTTTTTPTINLTFSSLPPTNPTIVPPPHQPVLIQPSSATITTTTATTNPTNIPSPFHSISADLYSTSSSTSSDEEVLEGRRKRKRKWKDFFERLMKEVIQKQEELQKKFLEAIEKREQERAIREEAWRMQEMARINREREILAQERSIAAAKDTAVMAFLQKMSEQQQNPNPNPGQQPPQNIVLQPPPPLAVQPISVPPVQSAPPAPSAAVAAVTVQASAAPSAPAPAPASAPVPRPQPAAAADNNGENLMGTSSSRWPKMEVQALIKLRTDLDAKYQESGPKGPLWEEISAAMRKIGYNRSAKRCKEKWENINKYFKKVKESNKKRPEDSKTCPYFHQLDALYREKNKFENSPNQIKPENTIPLMVRPEQQWPPQQQDQNHPDSGMDDMESDPMDQNQDEDDKDEDEEEDEGDGNYELVANRPPPASVSAAE